MSRRYVPYEKQVQAFEAGQLVGETLATAFPHVKHASDTIDQVRELADSKHLVGIAREEFIKGAGYGFADKRYCQK